MKHYMLKIRLQGSPYISWYNHADVVKFGDGSFAVTWSGFNNGGTDWGQAYLQYFDKSGAAVGQRQLIVDDTASEIYQWEEFTFIEPTFVGDTIEDLEISIDILNTYGQAATINVDAADMLDLRSVVQNINDVPSGNIFIEGTLHEGQIISVNTSNLDDLDGLPTTFNYQWLVDGQNIDGATNKNFTLTQEQVGKPISVEVTYTDGIGTLEKIITVPRLP